MLLAITPSGTLTARALGPAVPAEGTELIDRRGRSLGAVQRVFGPVERPYLAIRARRALRWEEAAGLIGSTLRVGGE